MTEPDIDLQTRFDRALASGARVAAPADPGFQPDDLAHIDQLRGRPFFQAVEHAAAGAAADRPTTWYRPDPDDIRDGQRAAYADAQELCAEIRSAYPSSSVHLLSAEDRLEAYLREDQPALVSRLARTAQRDLAGAGHTDLSDRAAGMVYALDASSYNDPSALSREVADDSGRPAGRLHIALMPAQPLDHRVSRSYDMGFVLENDLGLQPGAGHAPAVDPIADIRYSNDHEIGHLLDAASRPTIPEEQSDHDRYLSECRADTFAVLVEARRGGDHRARAEMIADDRNIGAVLLEDTVHWTPRAARAAAARIDDGTLPSGRLAEMGLPEVMAAARDIADAHALAPPAFDAFPAAIGERRAGTSPATPLDAEGATAADEAFEGYAHARLSGARGRSLDAPDLSWERKARRADPRAAALCELGDRLAMIEIHGETLRRQAGHPASTPRDIAATTRALADATDRMLSSDAKHARTLDGPESPRDQAQRRSEIAVLLPRAERIARAPSRTAALEAASRTCDRLQLAISHASPYLEKAFTTLARTSKSLEAATAPADTSRSSARAAPGLDDACEAPF